MNNSLHEILVGRPVLWHIEENLSLKPPLFVVDNIQYETIAGSKSYGIVSDDSDVDIVGFCFPDINLVFPWYTDGIGDIPGLGRQKQRFDCFTEHHIIKDDKEFDITIYNVIRYFHLLLENNPNVVDTLFTYDEDVTFNGDISKLIRKNRKMFLHKGAYHKYMGFAHSQYKKLQMKTPEGKRKEIIEKFGFDTKYAMNMIRLALEAEQILTHGDLDLKKDCKFLQSIKNGEIKLEEIERMFKEKEGKLEKLYQDSKIPHTPDENRIKKLLVDCLELYYGSLKNIIYYDEI